MMIACKPKWMARKASLIYGYTQKGCKAIKNSFVLQQDALELGYNNENERKFKGPTLLC